MGISEMIFDCKLELFLGIDYSRAEAFVCLNNHQVCFIIDKANSPELVRKEIVVDGEESEHRLQGLVKCPKASFECKQNFPFPWFPF